MQQVVVQVLGDYVFGLVGGSVVVRCQGQVLVVELGYQVWYVVVIDVVVGIFYFLLLWVGCEVVMYVFVYCFLQIQFLFVQCMDYYVGVDFGLQWYVVVWIVQLLVGWVVVQGYVYLGMCCIYQLLWFDCSGCYQWQFEYGEQ